jgi:hypothetical protein
MSDYSDVKWKDNGKLKLMIRRWVILFRSLIR